jgi:putative FmdB family regulatory protein
MPIYEYECQTCGADFDALRRISDDDKDVECPYCHEKNAERQISLTSFDGAGSKGGCGGGSHGSMRFG